MKNRILYGICLILLVFASCQTETDQLQPLNKGGFNLNVVVDELETGVKTRASIPSEPEEKNVNSLYLVFFNFHQDANGEYVGYYKAKSTEELAMNANIAIPSTLDNDAVISTDKSYSILAFANLESPSANINGLNNIESFLELLEGQTEDNAVYTTTVLLTGAGTDETNDEHAIHSSNLLMSGRVVKKKNETNITMNLKRGVARFDVTNKITTHTLASVSIWGAAEETPVWEGAPLEHKQMERFYGVKNITKEGVKGKLYAFENVVFDPKPNDKETTCLIIGLKEVGSSTDEIHYYRVNLHQKGISQDLKRNRTYRIDISSVTGSGSESEHEAWLKNKNELIVNVNNWNLDENGMIITDGTNTLGIPARRIQFDPLGETREYAIHTVGNGVLEITKSDLPVEANGLTPAFTAVIDGSTLRVTATKLPTTESTRRGSIELSFAGLRGTVDMIQQPNIDKFLYADKTSVPNFSSGGRTGISTGAITVTASGPWIAEIINTDDVYPGNPGFSFQQSGDAVTTLSSLSNPYGDKFQIYTTGTNPYTYERSGFVMISLVEDPDNYCVAIPFVQNKRTDFQLSPEVASIGFYADKTPMNTSIATGNLYRFTSNTDITAVAISGANSTGFVVDKVSDKVFTVRANDINSANNRLSATITVTSGTATKEISVYQEAAVLTVNYSGQIPSDGGSVNVKVGSSNLKWDARIEINWNSGSATYPHEAWLESADGVNRGSSLTNQPENGSFKVAFPALHSALTNRIPRVTVEISLHDIPAIKQTIEVTQLPLKPAVLRVLDVRHYSWGSLGGACSYLNGYNNFLRSSSLFGPTGRVNFPTISVTDNPLGKPISSISPEYNYVHAGGQPHSYPDSYFDAIEDWRLSNDGIVVFACQSTGKLFNYSNSTLAKLNYKAEKCTTMPITVNMNLLNSGTTLAKNLMNYLLYDGPFGRVNNPGSITFSADANSLYVYSYPQTSIPVLVNKNGHAMLLIDPENKIVYWGEDQMFDVGYSTSVRSDKDRFLGNLLSYVLNAAMSGRGFTEIFESDAAYNAFLGR